MLLLTIVGNSTYGQGINKADMLKQINKPKSKANNREYFKYYSNELETTGAILFVSYKSFFSSQDMASCVFSPSCSNYALQCFRTDNPFIAYVKVFDRLSRCHPFTKRNEYTYYRNTNLLYDPVH